MVGVPAPEIVVRPARPDEFRAVGELTTAVYVEGGYVPAGTAYAAALADTAARAAHNEIVVAEVGGVLAGALTITPPSSPFAEVAGPGELEFRLLAVAKEMRGKGIGTALVRYVLDRAGADGYRAVTIPTHESMVEARRIYDRLGFVHARDTFVGDGIRLTVLTRALSR